MNNVNEGWRRVRALMPLTGLALCASAFAADPTPAAAGAVATPDAAVAAAPESAPDATADNGDRAGNIDDSGGIPRAPRQGRLQELRDDRARAGGEYYRVPGVQSARAPRAGDLDRPFAG